MGIVAAIMGSALSVEQAIHDMHDQLIDKATAQSVAASAWNAEMDDAFAQSANRDGKISGSQMKEYVESMPKQQPFELAAEQPRQPLSVRGRTNDLHALREEETEERRRLALFLLITLCCFNVRHVRCLFACLFEGESAGGEARLDCSANCDDGTHRCGPHPRDTMGSTQPVGQPARGDISGVSKLRCVRMKTGAASTYPRASCLAS